MAAGEATQRIEVGEFVDPVMVAGAQTFQLTAGGPARRRSPREVLRRLRDHRPPAWLAPLAISARLRLEAAVAARGFDLAYRLDDRTLIAVADEDDERPYRLLDLRTPGCALVAFDLDELVAAIRSAPEVESRGPHLVSGSFPVRVARAAAADLPAWALEHRPGLLLRERLLLSFVFDRFELGGPASSITLLPGESRSVRRSVARKEVRRVESEVRGTEAWEHDWAREFERTFEQTGRRQKATRRATALSWSQATTLDAEPMELERERGAELESALDLTAIAERVYEVVEQVAGKDSAAYERVRIEERFAERSAATEQEAEFELTNPFDDRALTFVAHRLLAIHVVHLDLVGIDLVRVPDDPSAAPRSAGLADGLRAALAELGHDDEGGDVAARLLPVLAARYGPLGVADETADDFVLRPTVPGHPNLQRTRRRLMTSLDGRPGTGPLPVCLRSRRVALRSGSTYVRTFGEGPIAS